jgi:hypothetical protein
VPACSFDDPGRDRPAFSQGGGVVQVGGRGVEVAGAGVSAFALVLAVAVGGGAAPDPRGDLRGFAFQDGGGPSGDPVRGVGVAGVEERPGRFPYVFDYVYEIDEDRDRDAAVFRFRADRVDLGAVPVQERDPGALAAGVAAVLSRAKTRTLALSWSFCAHQAALRYSLIRP